MSSKIRWFFFEKKFANQRKRNDTVQVITKDSEVVVDKRHGSPYDRGSADKYYGRDVDPHYFVGHSYTSERISVEQMTLQQIAEYHLGYEESDVKAFGISFSDICDWDFWLTLADSVCVWSRAGWHGIFFRRIFGKMLAIREKGVRLSLVVRNTWILQCTSRARNKSKRTACWHWRVLSS